MSTPTGLILAVPATSVIGGVAVAAAAVLLLAGTYYFNHLVRLRNLLREAWSGIDVQLKRRHNLIPTLVEVVQGYSEHENTVLQRITELRAQAERSADRRTVQNDENALVDQLRHLLALVEQYPDLKANQNFLRLQEQLVEIEDQLQMARRYYNGTVRNYNTLTQSFPSNLVAAMFGHRPEEFFEIVALVERETTEVEEL